LADIKFYNRELTTLAMYENAFEVSRIVDTPECTAELVKSYANIERPADSGEKDEGKGDAAAVEQVVKLVGMITGKNGKEKAE
jgi:hypothetical protein